MGEQSARPARLVKMDELAHVLGKKRRTIERWIAAGKFPAPVRLGANSVAFALDDLLRWARGKHEALNAELERLAFSRPDDVVPEALEKLIAKEMSKQLGQRVSPDDVMFGVVAKLPEDGAARVRYAQWEGSWRAVFDGFEAAQLSHQDSIFLAYCFFPAIRAQIDDEIAAGGKEVKLPRGGACKR
jgi:predicted DNA-binding transcriptional regulator AlpA